MESERIALLPRTPVAIEGATYSLCGDFAALAEAETFFNETGRRVNLADAIFNGHKDALAAVREIFPCALRTFHPEITHAAAQTMIDRMTELDDPAIVQAVSSRIWPAKTEETEAANQNLTFDLEALADANDFFGGKTGLVLICIEGPFTLSHVLRVWPCALHRFRPELTLSEALRLMTLPSVIAVVAMLELAQQAASRETMDRFAERVAAVASEEDQQEFLFRMLAKRPWPGSAQA